MTLLVTRATLPRAPAVMNGAIRQTARAAIRPPRERLRITATMQTPAVAQKKIRHGDDLVTTARAMAMMAPGRTLAAKRFGSPTEPPSRPSSAVGSPPDAPPALGSMRNAEAAAVKAKNTRM